MNSKVIAMILVLTMMIPVSISMVSGVGDAAAEIEVTDGTGTTVILHEPADKVVTIGKGVTSIAINLGCLDKIVVCDKYSYSAPEPVFDELKIYVDKGRITAGGSTYSSGLDQLKSEVIHAADPETGTFDRETDVLVITGTESAVSDLKAYFGNLGFKAILCWCNAEDYDDIIGCTEAISEVLTGSLADPVKLMSSNLKYIDETLSEKEVEARNAFYITWSSGNWKVGNTGSLGSSMITVAGGISVTVDDTVSSNTYVANPTEIIEKYGKDTVIFADISISGNVQRMAQLQSMVPGVTVVGLESLWNNYSIESINGVWAMACAMYPDLFIGDDPPGNIYGDNVMIYVISGLAIAAVIACIALYMMKRP